MSSVVTDLKQPAALDIDAIRADFPILSQTVRGKPLVYLDNAASTQKPQCVINAISEFYCKDYSNIHRGVHTLSERATLAYEKVRKKVQLHINAASEKEIIFVRGATEAINLVAASYGRSYIKQGDEIVISAMEHHSNIVPWQMLCKETGALLKVIPINDRGELDLEQFQRLLSPKTRLLAIAHMSNALGTINPVKQMIAQAHQHGIPVLLDGAQAAPHMQVDVQDLDCDFYAVSGHKLYAPSGIGFLYGKQHLLEAMPPWQGGGDMIRRVAFEDTDYASLPYKFEAGTPNIADTIGLGAALDYINAIGLETIANYEAELLQYCQQLAADIPQLTSVGTATHKGAIFSFVLDKIHPHDIGTALDHLGIAIRAGHHCAMPVMDFFQVPATARASFGIYNTKDEVDVLIDGIKQVIEVFG